MKLFLFSYLIFAFFSCSSMDNPQVPQHLLIEDAKYFRENSYLSIAMTAINVGDYTLARQALVSLRKSPNPEAKHVTEFLRNVIRAQIKKTERKQKKLNRETSRL